MRHVLMEINGKQQIMVEYEIEGVVGYFSGSESECKEYVRSLKRKRKKSFDVIQVAPKPKSVIKAKWSSFSMRSSRRKG